jgi:hypothetical protein
MIVQILYAPAASPPSIGKLVIPLTSWKFRPLKKAKVFGSRIWVEEVDVIFWMTTWA